MQINIAIHILGLAAVLAVVLVRYRALILFAGYSGLRFGEVVGWRLERVDFLRSRVTVTDTIVEVARRLHHGPTKTGRGRVVTLPRFVTEELARHLSAYPSHPEGLVFTAPEGGAIRRSAFRFRVFLPAIEEAGLERLRIHDLRHAAAALAIRAGAPQGDPGAPRARKRGYYAERLRSSLPQRWMRNSQPVWTTWRARLRDQCGTATD